MRLNDFHFVFDQDHERLIQKDKLLFPLYHLCKLKDLKFLQPIYLHHNKHQFNLQGEKYHQK